jgi:hypothetical protein
MVKKADVQVTEVTPEMMQDVLDHLSDLYESGDVVGIGYGNPDGGDVWVDLDTGDVEITYPDGSVGKIAGTDPRAQEYWNPFGIGYE